LREEYVEAWQRYTNTLKYNNVKIKEDDDQLVWSLNPTGKCVPRICYKALTKEKREGEHVWWWRTIYKLRCPSKNKIFVWLILNNKAPT
jgi:hypothetical protein